MNTKIIEKNTKITNNIAHYILRLQSDKGRIFEVELNYDAFSKCFLGDKITLESDEVKRLIYREELLQGLATTARDT